MRQDDLFIGTNPITASELQIEIDRARISCARIERLIEDGNPAELIGLLPDLIDTANRYAELADNVEGVDLAEPQIPELCRQASDAHRRAWFAIVTDVLVKGGAHHG